MDILEHVLLEWPCAVCGGTCTIPARIARDSEATLCGCCPVDTERECPQLRYAALMEPNLLDELSALWARIEDAARARGCSVSMLPADRALPAPVSTVLAHVESYRRAKTEAQRLTRSESSIEHAGHYDTDTYPPPSSITADVLEQERDAAVALADEILGRCGYPCC